MIPWEQLDEENARRRARGDRQVIDARAPMAKVQSGLQGGRMDALTWANTFKNSQTGRTTSPSAAQELRDRDPSNFSTGDNMKADRLLGVSSAAPAPAQSSILQSVLGDIHAGLNFSTNPLPAFAPLPQLGQAAPSLTRLAEGAGNHAQQWTRFSSNRYGGGFTTYGDTSPRRPYIGGASGDMTKDFIAGGKFSSYKADSDPTLDKAWAKNLDKDRFSFASAFR